MKIRQTIVLGVIGSLFFIGTVIASPASAESPATMLPAEAVTAITQDSQITFEVIKEKHDVVEIDITYPVISGLTDADFQEQLNYFIKKQVIYSMDLIEMQADEFVQEAKKNGWEMRPYVLSIDYDLKSNDEAFLSFTMTYFTFTGGANGMTVVNCFNIDKKANKPLQLAALFPPGADYKAVMNREIAKQIELRSQDDNVMFFEGDMGFKGISDTQGFYLKDNDIVIVFSQYEIAPGAMGIPEFAVNRADLKKVSPRKMAKSLLRAWYLRRS
jgi:hypothetical protein